MRIPIYQVDAFTSTLFQGNPAAVCPLERWIDDWILQAIAAENNLSETAYVVARGDHFEIRWFTPKVEIDLAGHPTLASAFVIFEFIERHASKVTFHSKSGPLTVNRERDLLVMDLPARAPTACDTPAGLETGLGKRPREVLRSRDYLAVFETEEEIRALEPRMDSLAALDCLGVIATAPGLEADFVSRFFAPQAGVPEDPVTGSAHCTLIPFWADRLGRSRMRALQLSTRGGELFCENAGDRVSIGGRAVLYLEGTIHV